MTDSKELQYAALTSLGRLRHRIRQPDRAVPRQSSALLRAAPSGRSARSGREAYLPRVRQMPRRRSGRQLSPFAAVSALGKFGDRSSVAWSSSPSFYQLATADADAADEPRCKVVLLASPRSLASKVSPNGGSRAPHSAIACRDLIERLAWTVRRMPGKQSGELGALIKATALGAKHGETVEAFTAIQGSRAAHRDPAGIPTPDWCCSSSGQYASSRVRTAPDWSCLPLPPARCC